jgi:hypothetical protein
MTSDFVRFSRNICFCKDFPTIIFFAKIDINFHKGFRKNKCKTRANARDSLKNVLFLQIFALFLRISRYFSQK